MEYLPSVVITANVDFFISKSWLFLKMWFTLLVGVLIFLLYRLWLKPLGHWNKQNVECIEPWPLFGNFFPVFMGKQSFGERIQQLYNSFDNERCIGIHLFSRPQLILKSLSLIQLIGTKDFAYFQSNTHKRQDLGSIFGVSSMRSIFKSALGHALSFVRKFPAEDTFEIDCQDLFARHATDSIASVALGVDVNSLEDETCDFFAATRNLVLGSSIFTRLKVLLKLEPHLHFFDNVIRQKISERESMGANVLQMLLELRDGKGVDDNEECSKAALCDDEIVDCAKALLFEGIQSTCSLMRSISYELANNTDQQRKLVREIDDTLLRCNGTITYDALIDMKYLDMVVSESLRKWPPRDAIVSICEGDYTVRTEEGDIAVVLEKGSSVIIPVYAIHRDPKYFSNPEKFDPDRFSDENKCNIVPFSYIPFGTGRDNFIAPRLSLLVTKIVFFHLLSKFELVVVQKTMMPMIYMNMFSRSHERCPVGLKKRK